MGANTNPGTKFVPAVNAMASVGDKSRLNFKSVAKKVFWDTMEELMSDWIDPKKDLKVRGVTVKAADKYGIAGVYLFNQAISDVNNVFDGANTLFKNKLSWVNKLSPSTKS